MPFPKPGVATRWVWIALAGWLSAATASAELPEEDRCPVLGGRPGETEVTDAAPARLREGMILDYSDVILLRDLIPAEVWRHRNVFFFEGMKMEIGPCHRRYKIPTYYRKATEQFSGQVGVDEDGNLWGYVAGLPFPPESIAPDDPEAAVKWAWNLEYRNRGAGPHGHFRITDMPSDLGSIQTYTGNFFHLRTRRRADLPETDYTLSGSDESLWIGGGTFDTPFDARHLAWRQMRPVEAEREYTRSDSTFVYVPTMRKVRRAATAWVDGMYAPMYRMHDFGAGGSLPTGSNGLTPTGSISPASALSAAITEYLPSGFLDISFRPNAYHWRVLGEREVLAPINGTRPGYPIENERNFGSWGLSVGSDRWEVRQAVVIEGLLKVRGEAFDKLQLYIDQQTQVPLYVITRKNRGQLLDVGIPVHRFSGDVIGYPNWPTAQERALIFDPVAAVFLHVRDRSGWRRENYDVRSVPPQRKSLRRMVSTDFLVRGN